MTEQKPSATRTAILVVDDSKVIRIALQRILQGERVVYEAADGEEAWSLLQRNADIGLVLTDLSMPGLDGQDLLLRIRDGAEGLPADLPVAIITGQESDEAASREWLQLGANAVLMKPFVPGRVREVVNELLPLAPGGGGDQALRQEVERLRRELMLRQQSASEREAQREIERLRTALSEARDEATAALQRAEESEGQLAELQAAEVIAEEPLDEEAAVPDSPEQVEELEKLRARVREFENENIRLDHELVELDRLRETVQRERDQALEEAARLRQERNQQCERAAAAERARADLEARCSEQDGSSSALAERLAKREQELAEARERNQDLRARIRELELGSVAPDATPALSGREHDAPVARGEAHEPLVARANEPMAAAPALAADTPAARPSSRKRRSRSAPSRGWRWLKLAILIMVAVVVGLGTLIFFRNF
ncbi:response regulator receiver protein [Thioalkalivibrio sp. K90mix]|uniref:response regulator n=1 Tax=Thioalkalivibrio sp. (strain K90mix) TaxID=396595 RepID=UPI0001959796|nr:response regulator [Thioalkalivibrio sp. K90mix]ADC72841.1 response regulator receiver protein [Thioalkalivibrio sp. K90mix]